ncbi:MAG: hypothetical protein D6714_18230 [Bacteroidetes bacterium]|nr:MAG: hypothetical protein D6714_18230 [Bacteroidota bacterium]
MRVFILPQDHIRLAFWGKNEPPPAHFQPASIFSPPLFGRCGFRLKKRTPAPGQNRFVFGNQILFPAQSHHSNETTRRKDTDRKPSAPPLPNEDRKNFPPKKQPKPLPPPDIIPHRNTAPNNPASYHFCIKRKDFFRIYP